MIITIACSFAATDRFRKMPVCFVQLQTNMYLQNCVSPLPLQRLPYYNIHITNLPRRYIQEKCRIGVVGVGHGMMMCKYCQDAENA